MMVPIENAGFSFGFRPLPPTIRGGHGENNARARWGHFAAGLFFSNPDFRKFSKVAQAIESHAEASQGYIASSGLRPL